MNRSARILLASLVSAAALPAGAVSLSSRGVGQVLVYPYYTVNASHDTLLSIGNSSDVGKVSQVTIREGVNGRSVLQFRVFLAAHDVWTGAISAIGGAADSAGQIGTSDTSCVTGLSANPQAFGTAGFDGSLGSFPDSGSHAPSRTREGFIDVIALGDIVPGSDLEAATRHVPDDSSDPADSGAPTCEGLDQPTAVDAQTTVPTEGLFGAGSIIDVGQGTYYPYVADALSGFTDVNLMASSLGAMPNLQSANNADALDGAANAVLQTDHGRSLTLAYPRGEDAVSAVFMTQSLYNEYIVGAAIGANTDWVVTFPTRQFYVDRVLYPSDTLAPFEEIFGATTDGISRAHVGAATYNREQGERVVLCIEPAPIDGDCPAAPLSYQVNVLSARDAGDRTSPSRVLGSTLVDSLATFGDSGWIALDLVGRHPTDTTHVLYGGVNDLGADTRLLGLPATGFMVHNVINANAQPGMLANYSGLYAHRRSLNCTHASVPGNERVNDCP